MKHIIDLNKQNKKIFFENIYLTVLALYLLKAFFDTSIFSIPWLPHYVNMLRLVIIVALFLQKKYRREEWNIQWLFCIFVGGIFVLSWMHTGYSFLLDIPFLLFGAYDVPYKRILKVYIGCGLLVMVTTVIGACTGCIEDMIFFDSNDKISFKHSFGIIYSTDFAAHVVYLLLAVWVVYDSLPLGLYAVTAVALIGIVYFYSDAKCSTIVLVLFFVGMLYEFIANFYERRNRFNRIIRCLDSMVIAALPCCAAVMVFLMFRFDRESAILRKINDLITNRLDWAHRALENYGIHMWGTAFDMIGAGGNTVSHWDYNFVDSSYCMVLIRYGLVVFLVMCVLHVMCTWRAGKNGQRRLLIVLALIAIHNAIEHHILELSYNIFLILPFAQLDGTDEVNLKADIRVSSFKQLAVWALGGVIGTVVAFWAAAYGKTIVTLLRLYEPGRHRYFIIAVSGLVIIVFLFTKEVVGAITGTLKKPEFKKTDFVIMFGSPLLLLVVWVSSSGLIHIKMPAYEESMRKGIEVISAIKTGMEYSGKIYDDDLPVIYRKSGAEISWNILSGEGLVSKKNIVLLTGKNKELRRLMENGFLFGELSEQEGIYTNDKEVVQILENAGIRMNDFYNVKRDVDMALMADANGLARTDTSGVLVEGETRSLIHGPWLTLYRGRYRVEYHLKLKGTSIDDGSLAMARLSSNSGKAIIQEKELLQTDFNENGECVCVMEADIWDVEGVEFLLLAHGDTTIEIESIKYERVGKIG